MKGPIAQRAVRVMLTAVVVGCIPNRGGTDSRIESTWTSTLANAKTAVAAGRYADAEKRLAAFAESFPSAPESTESVFWRALFRLDPSNPEGSPRQAGEFLDRYLASPAPRAHDFDARVLRRMAAFLEQQAKNTLGRTELETRLKERDEELQRTKDELERIKRRLAAPKP